MIKEQIEKTKTLHEIPIKIKWSTQKKVIVSTVIAAATIIVIVIPVVLGVLLSSKGGTTSTTTQSSSTSSVLSIYWSLDSTTSDSTATYNGTLMNGATYFSTTNTQPFVGYGQGLSLASASSQFMRVSSPYIDLTYKSFTIEAWIFSTTVYSADYGIFSQCQCSICSNECLFFIVRGSRLYAGFTLNDITGSQNITNNLWYHVAFVYNYATQQQILYVNGIQDTSNSNVAAYQGINGTIDIGSTVVYSIRNYFNGYIDNVKLTTRAKTSSELLTAATLAAYFSFDVSSPYTDGGPNGLNGTQNNAIIIAGRVNQAIRFTGSSSYFYAYGFAQIGYGLSAGRPFSISLWINPTATSACTIVQVASSLGSYSCYQLIGVWTTIGYTGQIALQGYYTPFIVGPFITTGTWMHISATYSLTNGFTLYVNGVLFGSTGSFTLGASNYIMYLQLGYMNPCNTYMLSNTGYQGAVDEVYVHNRELSQADVTTLANP